MTTKNSQDLATPTTPAAMQHIGMDVATGKDLSFIDRTVVVDPRERHDSEAVNTFAMNMKDKLAEGRAAGRAGWEKSEVCSQQHLSNWLRWCVEKGDPIDVGILAMMLSQRGEKILHSQDNLQLFTSLRAILFDESKEPRNRLQELDNAITSISNAPAPEGHAPRTMLRNLPSKPSEQILHEMAERLTGIAAVLGFDVTIERKAKVPLAMRNFEPVISIWPTWTGKV